MREIDELEALLDDAYEALSYVVEELEGIEDYQHIVEVCERVLDQ